MDNVIKSKLLSAFPEIIHGTSTKFFKPMSIKHCPEEEIHRNRSHFFNYVGLDIKNAVFAQENHTANITIVDEKDRGRGTEKLSDGIDDTDAMVTDKKGVILSLYTADCLPILFYNPVKKVIAVAHAGWPGVVNEIASKTLERMEKEFGCDRKDTIVYIGPSIGPCCYGINDEKRIELFQNKYNNIVSKDGNAYLDLWDSVEKDLLNFGIPEEHMENSRICTACNTDHLASNYKEKDARRASNVSFITMVYQENYAN